uniref:Uncharacterized protein n=1 Tax=Anguilla anguilla TaxID=7936 RepID=A0A0E9TKP0_ANGAN
MTEELWYGPGHNQTGTSAQI